MTEVEKPKDAALERSRNAWLWLAVSSVLFSIIIVVGAGIWIFSADTLYETKARAGIIAPFTTLLIGLPTFFTIIWRGSMTDRQTKQQQEQIDLQGRQIEANDKAAYARLLTDGAELLGDENRHRRIAGAAILQNVVEDPKSRFSQQAMDILAAEWREHHEYYKHGSYLEQVRIALRNGSLREIYSSYTLEVTNKVDPDNEPQKPLFVAVSGFRRVSFERGTFSGEFDPNPIRSLRASEHVRLKNISFKSCTIETTALVSAASIDRCTFERCKIDTLHASLLGDSTFRSCNFSGAKIERQPNSDMATMFARMSYANNPERCKYAFDVDNLNFYDIDDPPYSEGNFCDWHKYLLPVMTDVDGKMTPFRKLDDGTWQRIAWMPNGNDANFDGKWVDVTEPD